MTLVTVGELRQILDLLPDDAWVYDQDGIAIRGYTLFRYGDDHMELKLFADGNLGLDI